MSGVHCYTVDDGCRVPIIRESAEKTIAVNVPMRRLALARGLLMALFFSLAVVVLLLRVLRSLLMEVIHS